MYRLRTFLHYVCFLVILKVRRLSGPEVGAKDARVEEVPGGGTVCIHLVSNSDVIRMYSYVKGHFLPKFTFFVHVKRRPSYTRTCLPTYVQPDQLIVLQSSLCKMTILFSTNMLGGLNLPVYMYMRPYYLFLVSPLLSSLASSWEISHAPPTGAHCLIQKVLSFIGFLCFSFCPRVLYVHTSGFTLWHRIGCTEMAHKLGRG